MIFGSLILLTIGLTSGFVLGGLYAASRATCAGHAASLVYFTGIHQALEERHYDRAETIAATAVDSHVAVLQQSRASRSACLLYVLPWSRRFDAELTRGVLSRTRDYFSAHQDQLRPETRAFLTAQP